MIDENEAELGKLSDRATAIIEQCRNERRDANAAEVTALRSLTERMRTLNGMLDAEELADQVSRRVAAIDGALSIRGRRQSPMTLSTANAERLEEARRGFQPVTVLEERSTLLTTDMGTGTEYAPGKLAGPRTLWQAAGIPTSAVDGYAAVVPTFTLPSGAALVAEGVDHPEFDGVTPDNVAIRRAGAWSSLTSEGNLSTPIAEISEAHGRIIARHIDVATVARLESTPDALTVDEALVTVAAEASADTSELWIVGGPVAIAALAGTATFAVTNGTDVGSYAVRYGGAQLYATPAATEDLLTVFYPSGFRALSSVLASAIVTDPKDGAMTFGQWQFFGLGQSLAGAAVSVSLVGS